MFPAVFGGLFLLSCNSGNYEKMGKVEESRGNYGKAIKYYKKALSNDDSTARLYLKIGNVYKLNMHDEKKALTTYLKGIEYFPNNYDLNLFAMQLFFKLDDVQNGFVYYKKCSSIKSDFGIHSIPYSIVLKLEKEKSKNEFVDFCVKTLILNPADNNLRRELARYYFNNGDALNAKKEYEALIKYGDRRGGVYLSLGLCNYNLGEYYEAIDNLEIAKNLGVEYAEKNIKTIKEKISTNSVSAHPF